MERLSTQTITELMAGLPGWTYDGPNRSINRELTFRDFRDAFAFMTDVAAVADRMDHHPTWTNTYNRVEIMLTTHDADGLTMRDIEMARAIDAAAAARTLE
ncbi:MAG TPA: 4a-hydroxytetrahydrobiopterin dehydratase [Burkholderiaceae bacterium]|nr:4a-hydroxytetrahydrobiopterin dehydratase [Burkholderiaceae bacterium]